MTNCSVQDCRVGRKICALLAMTNLVGFAEKRNNFQNETIENGTISGTKRLKNDAKQHRAKRPHKAKTSVSQIKTFQICVIARPQRGRGNLKVEGRASRGEARQQETTKPRIVDPSRRDTTTAPLRKRHFTRASARISRASASFTRSKIVFHRAAILG